MGELCRGNVRKSESGVITKGLEEDRRSVGEKWDNNLTRGLGLRPSKFHSESMLGKC